MSVVAVSPYLHVWTVVSLRPASQQAAAKRAIRAAGAQPLALPALRLAPSATPEPARAALAAALACAQLVFTSPAAVRHAAALLPLRGYRGAVFAPGAGTARVLARHGLTARTPGSGAMHSDGLLALPALARGALAATVGLVTAPGGRDLIAPALRARGATLCVAEVYRRLPPRFDRRHAQALRASAVPRALLLTSGEALRHALGGLPADCAQRLRTACIVASSARLVALAREHGCDDVLLAERPDTPTLLARLATEARRRAG